MIDVAAVVVGQAEACFTTVTSLVKISFAFRRFLYQNKKQGRLKKIVKDVDLIVRSNVVEEDDDLNEGFCHYSIVDDE